MKALLTYLVSVPFLAYGQINPQLKRELDSMYVLDQRYREYLTTIGQNARLKDSLARVLQVQPDDVGGALWTKQSAIDSANLARVEVILKQHGYPGKTLVGTPTNEAAWYIIQHSDKIRTYLPAIRKAGDAGELPFTAVAMMEDRQLTYDKLPQRYGTQGSCYPLRADPSKSECFIWPIDQPNGVNERRRQAGFKQTVEENAKRLDINYKPLTLKEVKARYVLGE